MKQVVSASTVAHLWANQSQNHARVPHGNFYFRDKTIYSYGTHFPIAKHVTNGNGETAVLFTTRGYSNTTSKHVAVARQASNHLYTIYCHNPEASHESNFERYLSEIENIAQSLTNARKPEKYLNEIKQIAYNANCYATFFGLEIPLTLQAAIGITDKEKYAEFSSKRKEYEIAAAKKLQQEIKKRHKKELAKWLAGETHRLYNYNGYDYLRLSKNSTDPAQDIIQTSQGVTINVEAARKLHQLILTNKLQAGDAFQSWEVREVGKTIRINCHNFERKYLIQFGNKIFNNTNA